MTAQEARDIMNDVGVIHQRKEIEEKITAAASEGLNFINFYDLNCSNTKWLISEPQCYSVSMISHNEVRISL